jgi:hypothetical protein
VNLKKFIFIGVLGLTLQGCNHLSGFGSDSKNNYASAQALIDQKNLNAANGGAKEYVYDWGQQQSSNEIQALYPRKYLGNYCHAKGGKFSLLYKSHLHLVKDQAQKKRLNANSQVKQGVGAYQCVLADERWIVSIEPTAEGKLDSNAKARTVSLQTRVLSADEAKQFYKNGGFAASEKKSAKTSTSAKSNKAESSKDIDNKKEAEKKKDSKPAEGVQTVSTSAVETPQQQQLKAYVAARRDLSKGTNKLNACNNAQRAYNFGKLTGTNANVYTDSGMLVARCLTSVPAYSSRFSNPKGQANKILQNLASNYNHAGAKRMLKQVQ